MDEPPTAMRLVMPGSRRPEKSIESKPRFTEFRAAKKDDSLVWTFLAGTSLLCLLLYVFKK